MKRCPACNRIFEEAWLGFCTQDGTALVAVASDSGVASPPPSDSAIQEQTKSDLAEPQDFSGGVAEQSFQPVWQPPPPPTYAQPENKGLATASMVCGISSTVCLGPVPAIVAIILGSVALSQIKKEPERIGGKQFAWIGIATGSLTVVLYGGIIIFYIVMIAIAASH